MIKNLAQIKKAMSRIVIGILSLSALTIAAFIGTPATTANASAQIPSPGAGWSCTSNSDAWEFEGYSNAVSWVCSKAATPARCFDVVEIEINCYTGTPLSTPTPTATATPTPTASASASATPGPVQAPKQPLVYVAAMLGLVVIAAAFNGGITAGRG